MRHMDYIKELRSVMPLCSCKSRTGSGVGGESKEQGATTCVDSRRQDRRDQGTELTKLLLPSQRQNIVGLI
jgi:hypothetical protein